MKRLEYFRPEYYPESGRGIKGTEDDGGGGARRRFHRENGRLKFRDRSGNGGGRTIEVAGRVGV